MFISATITKISFDRLTSILSGNHDLGRRFFHVVTLFAARSFLRKARTVGAESSTENLVAQEPLRSSLQEEPKPATPTVIDKKPKKQHPAVLKLKLDEVAPDEEILQEYSCKILRNKTKQSGQFYVMKENVGFYAQSLSGKKTRIVLPGRSITEVVARDDHRIYINNLKHTVGPFELIFKSQEKKEEAYTILASFLSDKKRFLAAKTGLNFTAVGSSQFGLTDQLWDLIMKEASQT